jgi:Flp pilus assembly protein TadG
MKAVRLKLWEVARRWRSDRSGNIAIIFAASSVALLLAFGGAVDLGRAYTAKQKLSQTATLACQFASRPSIIDTSTASYTGANGGSTYSANVKNFITQSLAAQKFVYTQTTASPFTYTQNGPADVALSATVPTLLMQIAHITQIPISAAAHCYDTPTAISQKVPNGSNPNVIQEGFENSACSGTCYDYYSPNGAVNQPTQVPTSTPSATPGYTGAGGAQWVITGYCLEVDSVGVISSSVPEGTHSAELDCDNGHGNAGNSSISNKTYLAAGNYELRWNYRSRVDYPNYDPVPICGSTASDVSWATDSSATGFPGAVKTNQINVYLDLNASGVPPVHTTLDGSQSLAGSNLIDVCVYSANWVERSIRIKVSTAGYYWLSFAADGANDSYGGQLDNIRLCTLSCLGSLQDNFPSTWPNATLFEDTFDLPLYTGSYITYVGNLSSSYGTYTGLGFGGWPYGAAQGWATAPYNETAYILGYAAQGIQSIQLDGANSGSMTTTNRLISRPFLLAPGYYKVSYNYVADAFFASLGSTVYCGSTPSASGVSALTGTASSTSRAISYPLGSLALNTNIVAVFMSHSLMASTPNINTTLNSTTTFKNPDGTTTATPTIAPDALSLTAYNSSQPNALLDLCGYATTWQSRSVNLQIKKTGLYWLTFSSVSGSGDGYGGSIDDVKLIALGSPYMSYPPASVVAVPVPNPQPSGTLSFSGFVTVVDPFVPPAPPQ